MSTALRLTPAGAWLPASEEDPPVAEDRREDLIWFNSPIFVFLMWVEGWDLGRGCGSLCRIILLLDCFWRANFVDFGYFKIIFFNLFVEGWGVVVLIVFSSLELIVLTVVNKPFFCS